LREEDGDEGPGFRAHHELTEVLGLRGVPGLAPLEDAYAYGIERRLGRGIQAVRLLEQTFLRLLEEHPLSDRILLERHLLQELGVGDLSQRLGER
jgi:hypothetical protein